MLFFLHQQQVLHRLAHEAAHQSCLMAIDRPPVRHVARLYCVLGIQAARKNCSACEAPPATCQAHFLLLGARTAGWVALERAGMHVVRLLAVCRCVCRST